MSISEAEYAVMEILWEEHPLSAQVIIDRIPPDRDWSVTTVKTLLARLVTKGVISATSEGRRFLYHPLLQRQAYVNSQARRMMNRLFKGKLTPFVAHLAESEQLSNDEIDSIERLLKELRQ